MPSSANEGKLLFEDWFQTFKDQISTVLDVGPGLGIYCDIIKSVKPEACVEAVEIFAPYVDRYCLLEKYGTIYVCDIQKAAFAETVYDLIILGDVLEHLNKDEAIQTWVRLKQRTKFLWLSLPLAPFRPWFRGYGHLGQPETDYKENIYEKHLYEWQYEELLKTLGPFLWQFPFRTVGVFVAEGGIT
ncbi:MAG: hypothetical protein EHM49_00085 [Deltaproteobacteria bacterium]|nr:MAG: hypothetical protein EHM49_00085 [Deltaproteobacteria bacterium]